MSVTEKYNVKVEKDDSKGEISISGSIPSEEVEKHKEGTLKFFSENVSIDGFRKGNVPEDVLKKHVSESAIYEEMASRALNEIYPEIVREEKLDIFGRPHVHFNKLAPGNPVEFTVHTAVMPKVEIPDYKEIAAEVNKDKEEVTVTDEEVQKALLEVRKELDKREQQANAGEGEEKSEGENKEESESNETSESGAGESEEKEPSPLTDEKIQKVSPAKTVAEFEQTVREDLKTHKEKQANEKHRLAIIEKILEKSEVTIPEMVVESELASMMAQFAQDVTQAGMKMEDYLKQAGKTEEELKKEWRPHAEKRAKMQLLLNKIATQEELLPKKEDMEPHINQVLEQNPQVERERAETYVETQLANQNVFEFLENQKQDS
ncbi:MAG: trigger factor [Candidatus Campbellbacteria bacterium]|nr:trigger factor [Candidatus Campbellbacteria bacterium]